MAADSDGLAMAADSWTHREGQIEKADQIKVWTALDAFVQATAGAEYIIDTWRFDPNRLRADGFAVDTWFPNRSRQEYLRHHLAGESSIAEIVDRWDRDRPPEFRQSVRSNPDVKVFHAHISDQLRQMYEHERNPTMWRRRPDLGGRKLTILASAGRSAGAGRILLTRFVQTQNEVETKIEELDVVTTELAEDELFVCDVANGSDFWRPVFVAAYERAVTQHEPCALLSAAIATVHAVIADDSDEAVEVGGNAHGAAVRTSGPACEVFVGRAETDSPTGRFGGGLAL